MASHLNLEEQEQIDQLKHFWKSYGMLITLVLVLAMLAYSAWTGYRYWQNRQSARAAMINEQVYSSASSQDWPALSRALDDVREQYASTDYAQQASLQAAQAYQKAGKTAEAKQALEWLVASGRNAGYQAIARLRLASLALESKDYAQALSQLSADMPAEFAALAADKRGDVLLAQGQRDAARSAYQSAYQGLADDPAYRQLVEFKLNALGVDVSSLRPQAS
jgi:predicted negative regulator of RcsB-dependent stress response